MNPYEKEAALAREAVRRASLICQHIQRQVTRQSLQKDDRSPVTVADLASQAAVCRMLQEAFPADPVIGEEDAGFLRAPENAAFLAGVQAAFAQTFEAATSDQICSWIDQGGAQEYSARFWTLDPIDGTKGFLRGEQYAVSLALIVDGVIQVGVLGCPNLPLQSEDSAERSSTGCLFSAVRGRGAEVRPLNQPDAPPRRLRVCETEDPRNARFCESVESGHSAHDDSARIAEQLGLTRDPVRLDSQAKYAVVARGEADTYLRLPTRKDYREKIWDHAGGVILVEEAGGRVTDIDGQPLDFTHGRTLATNRGVVATNGLLHERVLAAVQDVLTHKP